MQKFEKQQKIDELLDKFIDILPYEDDQGNSRDLNSLNNAVKDITSRVCNTLKDVLDGEYFMPRYYTLSNRLMEKETYRTEIYDVPSRVRNLIQKSMEYLSHLSERIPNITEDKSAQAFKAYCQDNDFRHYVDEFYSSVLHEILIYEANVASKIALNAIRDIQSTKGIMDDSVVAFEETAKKVNRLSETVDKLSSTVKGIDGRVGDTDKKVESMGGRVDDVLLKSDKNLKDAKDAVDMAKNMLPNLLTTLGIFVAIIIAIVGIYLSIILNSKSPTLVSSLFVTNSIWARIIFITLLASLVFDMLFVFLFWISKLSGRTIGCSCIHGEKCTNCDKSKRCKAFIRVLKRYWNFIIFNAIIVIIIGVSLYNHWNLLNDTQKDQFINNEIVETSPSPSPAPEDTVTTSISCPSQ